MDFNKSKNNYKELIEESVSFAGKDLDFFVGVKADLLKDIIFKYLPTAAKPRILDIGCGHGYIHAYLPNESYEVVGVEMADEVLELARKDNPDVTYISHDGKTLPFPDQTFDVAIAICVMHHVPPERWDSFLLEMKRILKPNGIAIIFEHNPNNPLTRHVVAKNVLDKDAVLLRNSDLEKRMIKTGFGHVYSRFYLFTPFASKLFRWFDRLLSWLPIGAQYYTIAKI